MAALNDLGIGWFTRPDGAFRIPRGSRDAYERKERLAYEMYRADVAQRKTGPTFKALSRSEAVDKYFNKLGQISSELSAGEDKAPVPVRRVWILRLLVLAREIGGPKKVGDL